MFGVPERYKIDVNLPLKDFIPKEMKIDEKKRLRNAIKSAKLVYQIAGEEIPSVINESYRCEVIQFYDIEIYDIKEARFIASIYQELVKSYCILHIYDSKEELFSFAIKRLNQTDESQIIIDKALTTEKYKVNIPNAARDMLYLYLDFDSIKNHSDKVTLYKEWFFKTYIVLNSKAYSGATRILESNCWYDVSNTIRIFEKYEKVVLARDDLRKSVTNSDRIRVNKEIKALIADLDKEDY